ncbi:MAG: DNA polymerase IV [Planctomycetota bacterium]|jgi:DNA polymerase-4
MKETDLDKRMRSLEHFRSLRLKPRGWPVLRLDGRAFHRFTAQRFEKPFDTAFRDIMVATARELVEQLQARYAYTMSDEISLLLPLDWDFFSRRVEKIVSVTAGMASATFTQTCGEAAHFDCRIWQGATIGDVTDYFLWRQTEAERNALHGWCYWTLRKDGMGVAEATTALDTADADRQQALLAEHGIVFADLPAWQRRGIGLYWESYEKPGFDPKARREVIAMRHRVRVDDDLPAAEDYARLVRRVAKAGPGAASTALERHILHVDMDAFFAAVEQRRRPELKGRPVIVGGRGDPESRAVVSAASYEARRFGVRSGMPLAQAYRACPEAVFLPVDFEAYATVSQRVLAILHAYSPRIDPVGLDEAFLDVTHAEVRPENIARAIKERVQEETGLTCSVGIAPNKLLAKIASGLDKPDGLTVIARMDVERRIWPLPVSVIWGIGPRTEERLAAIGVRSIGDLAAIPREDLVARFGRAHGDYFFEAARGIDDSAVRRHRERKSLGHETTFERDLDDLAELRRVLGRLADMVSAEARERGVCGRTITVKLRYADFETVTRRTTLPRPVAGAAALRRAALECFERIPVDRPVRLLGVRLSNLERR